MKGKRLVTILWGGICLVLILGGLLFMRAYANPAPAPIKPIELKFNEGNPPDGLHSGIYVPWMDEVYKRSQGRVKITCYFMGQLSPPHQIYDSVIKGIADMGSIYIGMTPGRFPCLELMEASRLNTVCAHPSRVSWELYQKSPAMQKEFTDAKVLAVYTMRPYPPGCVNVGTVKKPIRKLEDMKGLKTHAPGVWISKKVQALGASPMSVFIGDLFVQLEKKVLDGGIIDPGQLDEMKLREVIHYLTKVNFGYIPFFLSMNWNKWNSLPPDIQKVFEETGGEFFADIADAYGPPSAKAAEDRAVKEYGLEVIELSPEELARWGKATAPVLDQYVAELEAKGLPGKELLKLADELFLKYSK